MEILNNGGEDPVTFAVLLQQGAKRIMTNYEIKAIILRDDAAIGGTCPAAQTRLLATWYELADALERARVSTSHP